MEAAQSAQSWPVNRGALVLAGGADPVAIELEGPAPLPAYTVVELPVSRDRSSPNGRLRLFWLRLADARPFQTYRVSARTEGVPARSTSASFTTSDGVDTEPPFLRARGIFFGVIEDHPPPDHPACDPGYYAHLTVYSATDYNHFEHGQAVVFVDEADVLGNSLRPLSAESSRPLSGIPEDQAHIIVVPLGQQTGRTWCFVVRARDLAGNESLSPQVCCATTGRGRPGTSCHDRGSGPADAGPDGRDEWPDAGTVDARAAVRARRRHHEGRRSFC
jgi:hypothetical protein